MSRSTSPIWITKHHCPDWGLSPWCEQQFTHRGNGFLDLYFFFRGVKWYSLFRGVMWLPPCLSSTVLCLWSSSCFTKLRIRSCSGFREEGRELLLTRPAPGGSVVSQTPALQTQPRQPKTWERPGQTTEESTHVPTCPTLPEAVTWGWKARLVQGQLQDPQQHRQCFPGTAARQGRNVLPQENASSAWKYLPRELS